MATTIKVHGQAGVNWKEKFIINFEQDKIVIIPESDSQKQISIPKQDIQRVSVAFFRGAPHGTLLGMRYTLGNPLVLTFSTVSQGEMKFSLYTTTALSDYKVLASIFTLQESATVSEVEAESGKLKASRMVTIVFNSILVAIYFLFFLYIAIVLKSLSGSLLMLAFLAPILFMYPKK